MQLDWHDLKTNGCPALLRALKQIETTMTQQEEDITELKYLVSEELMARLAKPSELREVVEELGAGWRIERQPGDILNTTTVEDVDRQMAGLERLVGAFHKHFMLTPGYPQDGEA